MKMWRIFLISFELESNFLICGFGAVTPIGRNALASACSVRAGVSGFSQHPFMGDMVGKPIRVAQCPWFEPDYDLCKRITDCLISAIRESLIPIQATLDANKRIKLILFVNLPSHGPGLHEEIAGTVRDNLEQIFAGIFNQISITKLGNAGGIFALQSAIRMLNEDYLTACVVAGGDSYIDIDTLEWLEETEQLHGAGERNNAWGFVPGEGAGAILLLSAKLLLHLNIQTFGAITGVGVGQESKLIRTGSVCLGEGLTTSFREAFTCLSKEKKLTDVYCDMNGEPYRADEFAFSVIRTREYFMSASDFIAPADCWGDVGAASAILLIILACIAGVKNYANGSNALVWASSDTGERGAVVIETAGLR
jgi:3-oxoacyl-[acyl-carrier-protein] synthase-1